MTFIEAAVILLGESGTALPVQTLCDLAIERGMLSKPGKVPLSNLKAALTRELKKGAESRVVSDEKDVWSLAAINGAATPKPKAKAKAKAKPAAKAKAKAAPKAKAKAEEAAGEGEAKPKRKRAPRPKRGAKAEPAPVEAVPEAAPAVVEATEPVEAAVPEPEEPEVAVIPENLSPEERAIAEVYAEDLVAAGPAAANREYRDGLTADEDRPMRPEILPKRDRFHGGRMDRRERMKERREERKRRRKERHEKRDRVDEPAAAASSSRSSSSVPAAPSTANLGTGYVADAIRILASRDSAAPVSSRQISDIMKAKGGLSGAPAKSGLAIKAALLHDAQLRRARGLRPRVSHKGRDDFALPRVGSALSRAEAGLETALKQLEDATRRELALRLANQPLGALERIASVYLQATGWSDIEWLKRVEKSAYATARPPGESETWLIGVRVGPQPVDRRGVGELAAGVLAKDLAAGLLLSPVELSAEAESELARDEAQVSVVCGTAFSAALAACGVGVSVTAAPVLYLDTDFFSEISDE